MPTVKRQRSYVVIGAFVGILFFAGGIAVVSRRPRPTDTPPAAPSAVPASHENLVNKPINPKRQRARGKSSLLSPAVTTTTAHNSAKPGPSASPSAGLDAQASRMTILAAPVERSEYVPHITPAVLRVRVEPVYPDEAKPANLRGEVKLRLHLDKTGHVSGVFVLSGDRRLAPSAVSAVRQWQFSPFQQDGVPLAGDTTVSLQFPPAE
jgi:TonB family protein